MLAVGYQVNLQEEGAADRSVAWPGELKLGMPVFAYGREWIVFEVDPKLGTAQARAVDRRKARR